MADQMDSDPNQKTAKKRSRNPAEWKREKRKRLRIAGKEYVNTRGEVIEGKRIGADCKCRRKCYVNVSEEVRNKLFEGYYSLNSHDEQNAYLFGLIRKKDIARKRSKDSVRRTCTYTYYVRDRGQEIQVCRLAFARIHGISSPKIRNLCLKLDMNVMFPRDGRGKHDHRPKKIGEDVTEQIRQHVYSIIRTDKVKDFIKEEKNNGPDVNITKMWKDYLRKFEPEIDVDMISSKPTKNQRRMESMDHLNGSAQQSHLLHHSHPHAAMLTHAHMAQYGGGHMAGSSGLFHNQAREANPLALVHNEASNSSSGSDAEAAQNSNNGRATNARHARQSEEDSEDEERAKRKAKPKVKHWLYSKVFHDELKFHDFLSLRKKLWDLKGDKMNSSGSQGNMGSMGSKPSSSRLPKSQFFHHNMGPKSERKQKLPKKIARTKQDLERLRLERVMSPEMNTQSSTLSSAPPSSSHHGLHPSDMYILPVPLQDIPQMPPQRHALTAMDLVTSQQSHLAHHHSHHQHHAGMQLNLHSFAASAASAAASASAATAAAASAAAAASSGSSGSSQHQSSSALQSLSSVSSHQQNGGQLQCLTSNSMQSVNLSQNPCNYMNLNSSSYFQ